MNLAVLRLIPKLGFWNVLSVASHRAKIRSGWYRRTLSIEPREGQPIFNLESIAPPAKPRPRGEGVVRAADRILHGKVHVFGTGPWHVGFPPDWFTHPISGDEIVDSESHWSDISDFSSGAGDIKGIWELSRFGWAITLAEAFLMSGDRRYVVQLEKWVVDWVVRNPLNQGPNWKCGQETSLRMIQLLHAAEVLGVAGPASASPGLRSFVEDHCRRIEPTLSYAMAQENNHGTSEAAALFIGGAWLSATATKPAAGSSTAAQRWEAKGRKWLEDRVSHLVEADGSFSQYSINYHRLLVDTLVEAERWRARLERQPFNERFCERAGAAARWLHALTDPVSGDAPNLGANDGAHILAPDPTAYRSFDVSAARGIEVLTDQPPSSMECRGSKLFPKGGYAKLEAPGSEGSTWAVIRFPRYRFRPGDADPFHLDLWHQGRNILRDGGSFSYNPVEPELRSYISGPPGHNTIQFDGRDPMPRVGRFLRSHWLKTDEVFLTDQSEQPKSWTGRYRDHCGAEHERRVTVQPDGWEVRDRVSGFNHAAVLRWRLEPSAWRLDGFVCRGDGVSLSVESTAEIDRFELVEGWESRHYGVRTPLPVLELEVSAAATPITIVTMIRFDTAQLHDEPDPQGHAE